MFLTGSLKIIQNVSNKNEVMFVVIISLQLEFIALQSSSQG